MKKRSSAVLAVAKGVDFGDRRGCQAEIDEAGAVGFGEELERGARVGGGSARGGDGAHERWLGARCLRGQPVIAGWAGGEQECGDECGAHGEGVASPAPRRELAVAVGRC